MNNRQNPLFWSFGAGTWSGVQLRISWLMPVVLIWALFEFEWKLGTALFGVMFISVLLHEIGHILMARATEGSGDEILMWPLGGLAFVEVQSPRAQRLTALAGPLVNLVLCGIFLRAVHYSDFATHAWNPLEIPFPKDRFGENPVLDTQVLAFWFNWMCLLINLIPAFPLDGGQVLRSWLTARMGTGMGTEMAVRLAWLIGGLLAIVGLVFFKSMVLLVLAFMIILLAIQEHHQLQVSESYDDSFMGYDFSQGYTSLEKSEPVKPERRVGFWQRWQAKRRADKLKRIELASQQSEQQLDEILAKVHERGLASLTPAEKRLLKRASNRFRGKDAGSD